MNTSIYSSNISSEELLTLTDTYNEIDIREVLKITGTVDSVTNILNSEKFTASNRVDLIITGVAEDSQLAYLNELTSGRVEKETT